MATAVTPEAVSPALLPHLYRDPEVLERRAAAHLRAHLAVRRRTCRSCRTAGSYLTADAGLEPVLVLRDHDGTLRAFRNVCRHRGSRLLSGSGECGKAIRCRYHGWTYRFDGQLIGVPEGRSIADLDKSQLGLFPARVEVLCGLVFVNLDMDATPLAEQVRRPGRALRALRPRAPRARATERPVEPARQLEDRGGQLPRGLPRADRPSRADAPARLQALRGRAARELASASSRRCATSRRAT